MSGLKNKLVNQPTHSQQSSTPQPLKPGLLLSILFITGLLAFISHISTRFILSELNENSQNLSLLVTGTLFLLNSLFALLYSFILYLRRRALFFCTIGLLLLSSFFQFLPATLLLFSLYSLFAFLLMQDKNWLLHYIGFVILEMFYLVNFWNYTRYSSDEGYMILHMALFLIYISFMFFQFRLIQRKGSLFIHKSKIKFFKKVVMGGVLLFLLGLFFLTTYWNSMNLFSSDIRKEDLHEEKIFHTLSFDTQQPHYPHQRLGKEDLISFLKARKRGVGLLGCLYCLTKKPYWGASFKKQLLREAKKNKFLPELGSYKFHQAEVAERAYFYRRINSLDPSLFNQKEKDQVENWFEALNHLAYKSTWADWVFCLLFRQKPIGFYYNQEIGLGMLAILSEVLKNRNPELVKRNQQILNSHAVGWTMNFRNTDDGIVYHHNLWVQMAYLLYRYAKIGEPKQAKLSIEWIKHQSPYQSGIHPIYNYNAPNTAPALAALLIGIQCTEDSTFRYLADNYLKYMIKHRCYPVIYIGIDLWTDAVSSQQPAHQSVFIRGTTGTNRQVKVLKPDKLIIRKLIHKDELFIMVNLRSSGWHRYNGSGSVVLVQHKDGVLLKDNYQQKVNSWLPRAKRLHRDKKISPQEIRIHKKKSRGLKRLFFHLFSFDPSLESENFPPFIHHYQLSPPFITIYLDSDSTLTIKINQNQLTIDYIISGKRKNIFNKTL